MLPGYDGFGCVSGDKYESGNTACGPGNTLPGWTVDSFITYTVENPHKPNTWQWTVECTGSGPDLTNSGCKSHEPGWEPVIPEPGSVWLVVVGLCGLAFTHRLGVGRRIRS